jgi:hypothetical protein
MQLVPLLRGSEKSFSSLRSEDRTFDRYLRIREGTFELGPSESYQRPVYNALLAGFGLDVPFGFDTTFHVALFYSRGLDDTTFHSRVISQVMSWRLFGPVCQRI